MNNTARIRLTVGGHDAAVQALSGEEALNAPARVSGFASEREKNPHA